MFHAKDESIIGIPADQERSGGATLAWPHQLESTVRYLRIVVDDALERAGEIEV